MSDVIKVVYDTGHQEASIRIAVGALRDYILGPKNLIIDLYLSDLRDLYRELGAIPGIAEVAQ